MAFLSGICIQVQDEINKGHDPKDHDKPDWLMNWVKNHFESYFIKTDDATVLYNYAEIISFVESQNYSRIAKDEFARVSDSWIIAFAKAYNATLVTEENDKRKGKVKIPSICDRFGVRHINTFNLLRELKIQLN